MNNKLKLLRLMGYKVEVMENGNVRTYLKTKKGTLIYVEVNAINMYDTHAIEYIVGNINEHIINEL